MRTIFVTVITLFFTTGWLCANSLQATVDAQALEIKQLKRQLSLKEQELKILLITIKNSKQESMLHSTQQHLEFKDVNNVSATRVVIKPSMLSEKAIKEIDNSGDIDTDTVAYASQEANASTHTMDQTTQEDMTTVDTPVVEKDLQEKVIPKLTRIKPSTFALIKDTKVFKKIFAEEGDDWTKGMRFTSNKKRGSWIQITGKITDAGWKQVSSELWIDESCVEKIR